MVLPDAAGVGALQVLHLGQQMTHMFAMHADATA
jgi:hypothetical protein